MTETPLVVRDADGDAWFYIGSGKYGLACDVDQGSKHVERYASTYAELERRYAPLTVEFREEG